MTIKQFHQHHQFMALDAADQSEATRAFLAADWSDMDHWHDWNRSVRAGVSEPAASARQHFAASVWCYATHDHQED